MIAGRQQNMMVGLASFLAVGIFRVDPRLHRKPFGLQMCSDLCGHVGGCSVYSFNPFTLLCSIKLGQEELIPSRKQLVFNFVQARNNKLPAFNKTCPHNHKVFASRLNGIRCTKYKSRNPPKTRETNTRLLMAPSTEKKHSFRQLYISNNSVSTYPYLAIPDVTDIAFVSKSSKIQIATDGKRILHSELDSHGCRILTMFSSYRMAVDQDRQLVFLIQQHPGGIASMNHDGTQLKTLKKLNVKRSIAVDSTYKIFFFRTLTEIVSSSYDGKTINKIKVKESGQGLAVDPTTHEVLYNTNRKLFKNSVFLNQSILSGMLLEHPMKFIIDNGHLYIASMIGRGQLVSLKNMKHREIIQTDFSWRSLIVFCAIP